jgi:dTDP-4-amino-4,6-dideoxygalactose transaminase
MKNINYENLNLLNARYNDDFLSFFKTFLNKGQFVLGDYVDKFEDSLSKYVGTKYCIGVASGLDAMILSLIAKDYPPGSEIIVASNTYIATILAVIKSGNKPVLVEPDNLTCNINPSLVHERISSKTKAILVTHLYGKACDMHSVSKIAKKYGLDIFEDCAQSLGSKFLNKQTGSFGIGCHSFYPTKNLGALGDAGAITLNDKELYIKLRALRNYGSNIKYHNKYIGLNSRLDPLQAGFLSIKLKKIDEIIDKRRSNAILYHQNLTNKIIKPTVNKDYYDTYHIYNIRSEKRDQLKEFLKSNNIFTEIHYPIPPHKQEAYKKTFEGLKFPISEEIHNSTLSLPISPILNDEDIMYTIEKLNNFFE